VGEGESRESQEREGERGRGLNTPQWDSAWSDWLGSYGSCWLEVGAEGGFKLDLSPGRQDCDPGKQKLKGAVRTETYQCYYCQQEVGKVTQVGAKPSSLGFSCLSLEHWD
jgi:hypothetical protein